ncbi:hypothetical protein AAHD90_15595 [Citrobacter portucalensis]|uniref:Phage Integrase n=2 Tax=Enterobacteriaceae TaxID=543 RepID=A0A2H4ZHN1_RAOOR|nr:MULTISPECIES: hypothetical protein [Enterobacteriaceae]AUF80723.1 Phage Integrase [Raoultella ornithinolytica]WOH44199.1 hypothetical protein RY846_03120 [Citrobacter portucalensis]WOH46203.1 hypothetical protein RY846_25850 [Citrobacter portucalensis]
MQARFKPGKNNPGITTPEWVELHRNESFPLNEIIVSFDVDNQPLSYFTSDIWDFRAYVHTRSGNSQGSAIWNWKRISEGFRNAVRHLMYIHLFEKRRTASEGIAGVSRRFGAWAELSQLCIQCGIPEMSALTLPHMQQKLMAEVSTRKMAVGRVVHLLASLSLAHRYGFINFPHTNIALLADKLADKGKISQQTLAIPQPVAVQIYSHAIHRIEKWHRARQELASLFSHYLTLREQSKPKALKNILISRRPFLMALAKEVNYIYAPTDTLTVLYNDILAACGTVIGAVSGMRYGEWFELDADSYQEQTHKGITHSLLTGKTSKLNQGTPIRHAWVTAPVAKTAIDLLAAITEPRRAQLKMQSTTLSEVGRYNAANKLIEHGQSLFLALGVRGKNIVVTKSSMKNALDRLVATAPTKDGSQGAYLRREHLAEFKTLNSQWNTISIPLDKLWPIATHQFRRTFAIFLLRNNFGSFLQVKQQFAHTNISMSAWYGNNAEVARTFDMEQDPEIQAELAEMNILLMTDIAERLYLTDEPVSGKAGTQIREQIAQGNIIFHSREEINTAIRKGELTIVDNGHSLCLNPRCERLDCTIDPLINPVLCSHDVIMTQHARLRADLRERLIRRHKQALNQNLNQPNLLAKTLVGIRACEKIMADHDIDFEPYIPANRINIQWSEK